MNFLSSFLPPKEISAADLGQGDDDDDGDFLCEAGDKFSVTGLIYRKENTQKTEVDLPKTLKKNLNAGILFLHLEMQFSSLHCASALH